MPDVTLLLNKVGSGDPDAAAQLLQLVYDDLRRLAAHWLAREAHEWLMNRPMTYRVPHWSDSRWALPTLPVGPETAFSFERANRWMSTWAPSRARARKQTGSRPRPAAAGFPFSACTGRPPPRRCATRPRP